VDPESQYLRKACFLNYTIADYVLSKEAAQRYHLCTTQTCDVAKGAKAKSSSKARVQGCHKRSMRA